MNLEQFEIFIPGYFSDDEQTEPMVTEVNGVISVSLEPDIGATPEVPIVATETTMPVNRELQFVDGKKS